jgi:putative Holliday junction resolvase
LPGKITTEIEAFRGSLPGGGALVGLDLGTKTIGIAISDAGRRIASPLFLIRRKKFSTDIESMFEAIETSDPTGYVLGLPLNMDGSEGPRAQSTRAFARNLGQKSDLPVLLWDERLSTAAVDRVLIEADRSRARRSELVDKMAAAYILQGALDRLGN